MQPDPDWKVPLLESSVHAGKIVGHGQVLKVIPAVVLGFGPGLGLRDQFVVVGAVCQRLADEEITRILRSAIKSIGRREEEAATILYLMFTSSFFYAPALMEVFGDVMSLINTVKEKLHISRSVF